MLNRRITVIVALSFCCFFLISSIGKPAKAETPPTSTQSSKLSADSVLEAKRSVKSGEMPLVVGLQSESRLPGSHSIQSPDNISDWSKIAYQSWVDNSYEIMVASGNGNNPHRLTFDPAYDGRPRLNKDATKLVFTSNRDGDNEIFTMDVNGDNLKQITFNTTSDTAPAWSPDGNQIVFISNETGRYQIYTIMADGSNKIRLTSGSGVDFYDPSWSPDGSKIAYATWDANGIGKIWSIPAAGGTPTPFVSNNLVCPGDPVWSPDGVNIAFDSADQNCFTNAAGVITLSNGSLFWIRFSNQVPYEDHYLGSWSPDNTRLIFTRVQYVVNNGYLNLAQAYLETNCALYGTSCYPPDSRLPGSGLDLFPDWRTMDVNQPVSAMIPLPKYSRQDGFLLQWQSVAPGIIPVSRFNLQYRLNQAGWATGFLYSVTEHQEFFTISNSYTPGDRVSFRVQANDEAGDVEPWPTAEYGDAHTTLYTYHVNGAITDPRGYPVPGAVLSIAPQPVGQQLEGSDYQAWLNTKSSFQVTAQSAAYGTIPNTTRNLNSDFVQSLSFPPKDNLLQNGGYESGSLQRWKFSSPISSTAILTASISSDYRHTGQWAATLGSICPEPCLASPESYAGASNTHIIGPEGLYVQVAMALGKDGSVNVLSWQNQGLIAASRAPGGGWSQPVNLDPIYSGSPMPTYLKASPNGDLLAIWLSPTNGQYRFARKTASGSWETPIDLPVGMNMWQLRDVVMDSSGGLYVLYGGGVKYSYLTPAGVWQPAVMVADPTWHSVSLATMAISPDNTLHFFWANHEWYGDDLFYESISPQGLASDPIRLIWGGLIDLNNHLLAIADKQGQVHLFYPKPTPAHIIRNADGTWSAQESGMLDVPNSLSISDGVIQAASYNGYFRWSPEQGWYVPPSSQAIVGAIAVDDQGILHTVDTSGYQTLKRSDEAVQASLSQSITLPSDMHKPTLSFMAQWRGGATQGNSIYNVTISDGISQTTIFTGTTAHAWKQSWIPLDCWLGEEITVTFALHQAAGEPLVYLDLDDISLGSWLTPVIKTVTPNNIPHPTTGQTITITGENFLQPPSVWIDEAPVDAASVTWVDEYTFCIVLPQNISPGYHDLKVVNPGGQAALANHAFRVGYFSLLPLITR